MFIVTFGLINSVLAQTTSDIVLPTLKVSASVEGEALKVVDWPMKLTPLWKITADGGMAFYWALKVQIPGGVGVANIQAQKSEVGIKAEGEVATDGQTVFLGLTSVADQILVTLKDNKHIEIQTELSFENPQVNEAGCEEHNLKLTAQTPTVIDSTSALKKNAGETAKVESKGALVQYKDALPFYLNYRCDAITSGVALAVTVPKEVSWVSNSIFESKGKGKNSKLFEINPQLATDGVNEIGTLVFEYNGVQYPFKIALEKTEVVRPISTFKFSLGMMNLGLKNNTATDSTSNFASYVAFELRPFTPDWSFGAEGLTSLPSVSNSRFFSHTESMGYLGYVVTSGKKWFFEPRFYLYLADGVSKNMKYYFVSNIMAVGGILKYQLNVRDSLSLEGIFMSNPNQSILSSRLFYSRKNRNQVGGWGAALVFQQVGMNLDGPSPTTGTQVYIGPCVEF